MAARGRFEEHPSFAAGDRRGKRAVQGIRALRLTAAVGMLLALLAIAADGASAAPPAHSHKEVFGSAAKPQFPLGAGVAVDQATGNVYVIDFSEQNLHRYKANGEEAPFSALSGSNVIDGRSGADQTPEEEIFSNSGSLIQVQVAIAPPSAGSTAGDIYVTDALHGQIDIFSSGGAYLGQKSFGHPCGVAVDSSGTVFVGNFENEAALYKLEATSPGQLNELAHFPTTEPCQVAAGFGAAAGSVFVAQFRGPVTKFNATTGAEDYKFLTFESVAMTSDAGNGHVYVATGENPVTNLLEVVEFDASGSAVEEVSSTPLPNSLGVGVGVDPLSGELYVAELGIPEIEVFDPITKALSVPVVGSGEVKCRDVLAASFGPCAAGYPEDHTIKLQAFAASGSSFEAWSGFVGSGPVATPCAGAVTECEVDLAADLDGTATFVANPTAVLKISRNGTGSGSVSSVPRGIDCGSVCESAFQTGKPITLEAAAAPGSTFVEWSGCDSVAGSACHLSLSGARSVGAVFSKVQRSLTINKSGDGGGTVACDGGACSGSYPDGTTLTLTATPDSNSNFTGWSGGGCFGGGSCTVTLDGDTAVTSAFDRKAEQKREEGPKACAVTAGSSATVTKGQAAIRLTCAAGTAGATDKLTLKAKVKQGKKRKTAVIGTASFSISAGETATVKVEITQNQIKKQLSSGKAVLAQISSASIKPATVKLRALRSKR